MGKEAKPKVYYGVVARFPLALRAIAEVSAYGTAKHGLPIWDMSYRDVPDAYYTYTDAMLRHILAEAADGPRNREDGGMLHAAQAAWNALARLEIMLRQPISGGKGAGPC